MFFILSIQKKVVSLHPKVQRRGLEGGRCPPLGKPNRLTKHPSRGFQDIFKRRLLTLCSGLMKCRSFELMFQDLATVDVLRGMKYPLVPFGTLMCTHTRTLTM